MTTTSPRLGRSTPATLSEVVRRYWWPVYGEARSLGNSPQRALQITAAVLGRAADAAIFQRAEGHDGRLRLLIRGELTAVLAKPELATGAPTFSGISIEEAEARDQYVSEPESQAFNRRWGIVVLEQALQTLGQKFAQEGQAETWNRLKPYLSVRVDPASDAHNSVDSGAVEQLRERFRHEVRQQVAETVTTPLGLDAELGELFRPS